ncbi:MAG TPA: O-antigen ligase family protein [Vicinamibacteria bacterium]|nr:O-antigen ligase family protein [Vicinamibacteria bacterium]
MRRLALLALLVFLLANLAFRALTLHQLGHPWADLLAASGLLVALSCVARPRLLAPVLGLFGATFFLYGFHSYRVQSLVFEYGLSCLALSALLVEARRRGRRGEADWVGRFLGLYLALSLLSLLLLPPSLVRHGLLLRGPSFFADVLTAFPSDPLYPLAGVNRLALFVVFARQLARLDEGRALYRLLFRGIAVGAVACVILGLMDFANLVSPGAYNMTHTLHGFRVPRLQSTFANPTWYACFVTCVAPLVALEYVEGTRRIRALLLLFVPLYAASLFLAATRASWLVALLLSALFFVGVRGGTDPAFHPPRRVLAAVGAATLLVVSALAFATFSPAGGSAAPSTSIRGRLEGLAQEIKFRGVLWSPRVTAFAYAWEIARESPAFGSGYEAFNLHLRSLGRLDESRVANIESTTYFDDAHNTYLQTVVSTGIAGLALWLVLAAVTLATVWSDYRRTRSAASLMVLLLLASFHLHGFFLGMQYIPVIWVLFFLGAGYAEAIAREGHPTGREAAFRPAFRALLAVVAAAAVFYASHRGFGHIRANHGLAAYPPPRERRLRGLLRSRDLAAGRVPLDGTARPRARARGGPLHAGPLLRASRPGCGARDRFVPPQRPAAAVAALPAQRVHRAEVRARGRRDRRPAGRGIPDLEAEGRRARPRPARARRRGRIPRVALTSLPGTGIRDRSPAS